MSRFILKRFLGLIPTLLIIVILSFWVIRWAPGSPFLSERALSPEIQSALEARYGFNETMGTQLWKYLEGLLHGDLGLSTKYPERSVRSIIADGFPSTFLLGLVSLIWALVFGIGTGLFAALKQNRWPDHLAMGVSMVGLSVPTFVLGPLLILVFSLQLGWLPPAGWGGWEHVVLPSFTLGTVYGAYIARLTRAGVLEVLHSEYVLTAKAKGLKKRTIIFRHILRGGLIPVITFLGPATAHLMVGSVVVEKIFDTPGIGPYFVDAAFNRDYFLVMGVILLYSVFLLFMNFVVDVLYTILDPRVNYEA